MSTKKISLKRRIADSLVRILPLHNTIILESAPLMTDNTQAVFEALIDQGWNEHFRFVWLVYPGNKIPDDYHVKNVKFVIQDSKNLFEKLRKIYYYSTAKAYLVGNALPPRKRDNQYYLYLAHGSALKDCSKYYYLRSYVDEMVVQSDFLAPYDMANMSCPAEKILNTGYPRNDILINNRSDLHPYFPDRHFSKVIYWLPTFRQLRTERSHSNISMPILYNEDIANRINAQAAKLDVLLVIKPHPGQDLRRLTMLNMSNLLFIDNNYLTSHHLTNYQLMASTDALLTDYSSVYYDYLLVDRPIGLCWDDFDQYNAKEGFRLDPQVILAGGEKIYNEDDMIAFINRIAQGQDLLAEKRRAIRDQVQQYQDGGSTQRVVEHLKKRLHYQ